MSLQSIQARAGASAAALAAALMFVPTTPAAANPTPRPADQVTCQPDGGVREPAPSTRAKPGKKGAGGQTDAERADPVPDPGTASDDTTSGRYRDDQSEEAPADQSSSEEARAAESSPAAQPSDDQTTNSKATNSKASGSVSAGGAQAQLRKILQELYDLLQSLTGQE